jgi:uncharacterized protein YjcR
MQQGKHHETGTRRVNNLLMEGISFFTSAALLARALGVSPATARTWKHRNGAMSARNQRRLEQLVRTIKLRRTPS